ncbi:MAG: LysR family transcriptional regulator [Proteobacteria bacterium]|nr:LysR family transcriptional regulator [Pseudomonadota bacterium]
MNLKHFRAFDAVARHLHFTRAAEELNITQPTLSLLIRQLEASLAVTLLVRSTRQVELTDMGSEFLPFARNVVRDSEAAMIHMRDLASLRSGKVSVAAFPSVSLNQLPGVIVEFRQKYPDIQVQLHDGVLDAVIDKVRDGQADFALASVPDEARGLSFQQLYDDEILLVAPRDHPLAKHTSVGWRDITDEQVIMPSQDTAVRRSIDKALAGQEIQIRTALEPALIQTIAALVAAGTGPGVILASFLRVIDRSNIVALKLKDPVIQRPVGILTREDRQLGPAATVLKNMFAARLSGAPPKFTRS